MEFSVAELYSGFFMWAKWHGDCKLSTETVTTDKLLNNKTFCVQSWSVFDFGLPVRELLAGTAIEKSEVAQLGKRE
jgi:hypothetical protein